MYSFKKSFIQSSVIITDQFIYCDLLEPNYFRFYLDSQNLILLDFKYYRWHFTKSALTGYYRLGLVYPVYNHLLSIFEQRNIFVVFTLSSLFNFAVTRVQASPFRFDRTLFKFFILYTDQFIL